MADPYCRECAQATFGCWRHNGSGVYAIGPDGMMRQIAWPTRIEHPGGGGFVQFMDGPEYRDSLAGWFGWMVLKGGTDER